MATAKKKPAPKAPRLLIPESDLPNPEAANWFHFARVGADFQMLVGYVDLYAVHRLSESIKNHGESFDITADVTHRFVMSERGIRFLKTQLDDLILQMERQAKDPHNG